MQQRQLAESDTLPNRRHGFRRALRSCNRETTKRVEGASKEQCGAVGGRAFVAFIPIIRIVANPRYNPPDLICFSCNNTSDAQVIVDKLATVALEACCVVRARPKVIRAPFPIKPVTPPPAIWRRYGHQGVHVRARQAARPDPGLYYGVRSLGARITKRTH